MSELPNTTTQLETSAAAICSSVRAAKRSGATVGFVPTMGALHQGHLSLVEASLAECDKTVVSIFVNPTQFSPNEDLESYPRPLEQDFRLLEKLGCWVVFAPPVGEVYRQKHETTIDVGSVALPWEGASRPEHFGGVATVVLKLFQIVPADRAYFGQKDYQQTLVIQQMVADLNIPVEIRVCPIVREPDGLAMSSRNAYLLPEERSQAGQLWKSLELAESLVSQGERRVTTIREKMKNLLASSEQIELEYLAFLAQGTVREVDAIEQPTVVALAARVGRTRLLDNHTVGMKNEGRKSEASESRERGA